MQTCNFRLIAIRNKGSAMATENPEKGAAEDQPQSKPQDPAKKKKAPRARKPASRKKAATSTSKVPKRSSSAAAVEPPKKKSVKKSTVKKKTPAAKKASPSVKPPPDEDATVVPVDETGQKEPAAEPSASVAPTEEVSEIRPPEQPVKPVEQESREAAPELPATTAAPAAAVADETESDPVNSFVRYTGAALALLILLVLFASAQNTNKYFVIARDGAVEIWRGSFAPMGKKRLLIMPGVQAPELQKEVLSKLEVYPIIFQYYMDKAEALLDIPGAPDFAGVNAYLNQARQYATTQEMRASAEARITSLDRMVLLYKADMASSRGTPDGFSDAEKYLKQAAAMNPDEIESNLIRQKLDSIQKQMESFAAAEAQAPPAEEAGEEVAADNQPPAAEKADADNQPSAVEEALPEKPMTKAAPQNPGSEKSGASGQPPAETQVPQKGKSEEF